MKYHSKNINRVSLNGVEPISKNERQISNITNSKNKRDESTNTISMSHTVIIIQIEKQNITIVCVT